MRRPGLCLIGLLTCLLAGLGAIATTAQAGAGIRWHRSVRLESATAGGVLAVSCPTSRLCVAVDADGRAMFTTHPEGGAHSWSKPQRIDGAGSLTGVSCPTTRLCVAVDDTGHVLSTTRPTKGAKDWSRPARVDSIRGLDGGYAGLLGISCPTIYMCMAVDGASGGNVVTTNRPTGGSAAWRTFYVGGALTSISCAASTLCVIGGSEHIVSTDPLLRGSWRFTGKPAGGGVINGIDCPLITLCAGVGFGNASPGLAVTTATPRGGPRVWRTSDVLGAPPGTTAQLLDAVGCAGATLCVALDTADDAFVTTRPTHGGWTRAGAIRRGSTSQQNAISCTPKLCVVVDSAGVEVTGVIHG